MANVSLKLGDYWNENNNIINTRKYWTKSLEVFVKLNRTSSIAGLKLRLGKLALRNGNASEGLNYINAANAEYKLINSVNGEYACLSYQSEALEMLGRHKEALTALHKSNIIKDSLDQKTYDKELKEIQTQFETAKKDVLLSKQETEIEKQKNLRNLLFASSLFGGLLALGFWNRSRLSKKVLNQESEINSQKIMQLEKEKKILSMSAMFEGQEAERIRIAKDLHDGIGGLLSTVKAHFSNIQAEVEKVKKMKVYDKTNELIDQASSEVRRISHNLMPGALRLDGLKAAIEQIAEDLNSAHPLNVKAEIIADEEPTDEKTQVYIYRIIQEASNNVIKYADAKNYLIQFSNTEHEYHLILEDDGKGFDKTLISNAKGLGLKSIKSRVTQLNGDLDIDSRINEGTTLSIHIPKITS